MNRNILALLTAASAISLAACSATGDGSTSTASSSGTGSSSTSDTPRATAQTSAPTEGGTPITLTTNGQTITATLNDSQVSRDFIATLPTTLPWFRNAGIEYITELDAPLTETGPFYTDVQPADIVYYNPLDSITIIYEETTSVPTLTKMGEVTSDLGVFDDLPDDITFQVALQ